MSASAGRRPGRQVYVTANTFRLQWRNDAEGLYQYDVMQVTGHKDPPRPKKALEIFTRMQIDNPHIFTSRAAIDGVKNIWSTRELKFSSATLELSVPWTGQPYEARTTQNRKPKEVQAKIVFTRRVDRKILDRVAAGNRQIGAEDEQHILSALNGLNVVIKNAPTLKGTRDGRRIFVDTEGKRVGPFKLVKGFFQSVRLISDGLMVNVDITTGLIIRPAPLVNVCLEFLQGQRRTRNGHDSQSLELRPTNPDFRYLKHHLKNVKFRLDIPGHTRNKVFTIQTLVANAGQTIFDRNGTKVTVSDHFHQHHNVQIRYPKMIGVQTRGGDIYPLQVCEAVDGQLYKRSLPKWIQEEVIASSKLPPHARLNAIKGARPQLSYDNSPWMHEAGLRVAPEPMSGIPARILPPSELIFGNERENIVHRGGENWKGVWDVKSRTFVASGSVNRMGVLNFASMKEQEVVMFVHSLRRVLDQRGIVVSDSSLALESATPEAVDEQWLHSWVTRHRTVDLIIAILPSIAPDLYRTVKRFGDIKAGIVTQCVRFGKRFTDNQYLNNLSLKINAKLGGVNNYARDLNELFVREAVMVLGADVSRPAEGNQPAIASLVSSWDQYGCQYMAQIRVQPPRQEMISDLQAMVYEALKFFYQNAKKFPDRMLFYRDGTSEGEYKQVGKMEITAIRDALAQAKLELQQILNVRSIKWPELTFIIVAKRHHIRFFPDRADPRDPTNAADESGNCRPGLVVDSTVTNPTERDFYLQSHSALKGSTSRPAHYVVLLDTSVIPMDTIQKVSYALCHVYARASRAVSRPAPVYYADLVCRRARFHFDSEVASQYDYRSEASGDQPFDIDHFRQHWRDVHDAMKNKMYFV